MFSFKIHCNSIVINALLKSTMAMTNQSILRNTFKFGIFIVDTSRFKANDYTFGCLTNPTMYVIEEFLFLGI